jgi:hypothetical protein
LPFLKILGVALSKSGKKEDLINKKNPEWKELVTENGFVRKNKQISRFARNDTPLCMGKGECGGGKAATTIPLSFCDAPSFRRSEATEESLLLLLYKLNSLIVYH